MKISFLGQGFEVKSINAVGNYLIKFLNLTGFDTFTGISAFASESGIYGLSKHLNIAKKNFKNLNLIVGIDLEGTSKEALEEILGLSINSFIFYQKEQPIFHPKIYLFEGPKEIKMILGSSNLTSAGLFTNVESSMIVEFDTTDKEGLTLLSEVKNYYKSLFNFSDPNLFKISSSVITEFYSQKIIPDEAIRRRNFHKKSNFSIHGKKTTPTITIPKRTTARIPSSFPTKPRKKSTSSSGVGAPHTSTSGPTTSASPLQAKVLIWQKLALSKSDAQEVPAGTNGTGNLKLSQASFKVNGVLINQDTYFRNQVFQNLTWAKTKAKSKTYEETICNFDISILGTPYGVQSLKLSYDPIRISNQRNTPSWLHWGNVLISILQNTNVTGRTLNLYQSNQAYSIEIV
jgi:HKD family nuclease